MVDGEPRGETPLPIRGLELGAHTVVVSAAGYPRWEQRVVLSADQPSLSLEIPLDAGGGPGAAARRPVPAAPSTLQVDSRPAGAQVWVDGTLVGATPLVLPAVAAGSHSVRIELPGYQPWVTSVAVGGGERTRVAASLER